MCTEHCLAGPHSSIQTALLASLPTQVAERPYTHRIEAPRRRGAANPAAAALAGGPAADAAGGAADEREAADSPAAAAPATESLVRCRFVLERVPGQAPIPRTADGRCLKVGHCGQSWYALRAELVCSLRAAQLMRTCCCSWYGGSCLTSKQQLACRLTAAHFGAVGRQRVTGLLLPPIGGDEEGREQNQAAGAGLLHSGCAAWLAATC